MVLSRVAVLLRDQKSQDHRPQEVTVGDRFWHLSSHLIGAETVTSNCVNPFSEVAQRADNRIQDWLQSLIPMFNIKCT